MDELLACNSIDVTDKLYTIWDVMGKKDPQTANVQDKKEYAKKYREIRRFAKYAADPETGDVEGLYKKIMEFKDENGVMRKRPGLVMTKEFMMRFQGDLPEKRRPVNIRREWRKY